MIRPDELLEEVAGAIIDATPIDWARIEARTQQTDKVLLEQLKILARLRVAGRASESPDLSQQEYWGHLRMLERIGRGAFGEVYRAWDTRLDREVALKLLPPDSVAADARGSSIIEEGRLLARVRHPNVVTIYGAERIDGRVGLWMEFVKGRTLEEALRDGKQFTAKEVTRIGVELCRAVSAVHAAGLLHRDIKAQNVMVAEDGRLVLMDFGTGRELDATSETNLAGTPLYLAPEVLSGGAATTRSEVYGIGVVLSHLLTGSYPVMGSDLADLRRAHAERERRDRQVDCPEIPTRLRRVIARAIHPDPHSRYPGADSLGAALAALERAATAVRVAYSMAAAATMILAATLLWGPGTRNVFLRGSSAGTVAAAVESADAPVIAVLPFSNLSSESDRDYFADGLTDEIIRNLSVIDGLTVRSRTSSFALKGKGLDAIGAGRQLDAEYLVEGSVLQSGDQLRINTALVGARDGSQLWAGRYDRKLTDVFAIQDEISRGIVNTLRLRFSGRRRYEANLEAYDLYLRGRQIMAGFPARGRSIALPAVEYFERAIAMDPNYAIAYAGKADAYIAIDRNMGPSNTLNAGPRAKAAAARALELDPMLSEAHSAMAMIRAREYAWHDAERGFRRAIELNPNNALAHLELGIRVLALQRRFDEGLEEVHRALALDPLSPYVNTEAGEALLLAGHYGEAVEQFHKAIALDPSRARPYNLVARALYLDGKFVEALDARDQSVKRGVPAGAADWMVCVDVRAGRREQALALLQEVRNSGRIHRGRDAFASACLGEQEGALKSLEQAFAENDPDVPYLLQAPELASLRANTRFAALRKKVNLEP